MNEDKKNLFMDGIVDYRAIDILNKVISCG